MDAPAFLGKSTGQMIRSTPLYEFLENPPPYICGPLQPAFLRAQELVTTAPSLGFLGTQCIHLSRTFFHAVVSLAVEIPEGKDITRQDMISCLRLRKIGNRLKGLFNTIVAYPADSRPNALANWQKDIDEVFSILSSEEYGGDDIKKSEVALEDLKKYDWRPWTMPKLYFIPSIPRTQTFKYVSKEVGLHNIIPTSAEVIPRGSLVASESPFATFVNNVTVEDIRRNITPQEESAFNRFRIRPSFLGEYPTMARFKSNRLRQATIGGDHSDAIAYGIFPELTEFSSSCSPNLHPHWNSTLQRMELRAVEDIPRDTELTISHDVQNLFLPCNVRRAQLMANYGINCVCAICNGTLQYIEESDARRASIGLVIIGKIGPQQRPPTIDELKKALDHLEEEGLYFCRDTLSYDLYSRCSDQANNAMLSDRDRQYWAAQAKTWLASTIELAAATVGEGDRRVIHMRQRLLQSN